MSKRRFNPALQAEFNKINNQQRKLHALKIEKAKLEKNRDALVQAEQDIHQHAVDLQAGKFDPNTSTQMMIEQSIKTIELQNEISDSDISSALKQAFQMNKEIKSIFKNYSQTKDIKLLFELLPKVILKLESIKKSATNIADISGLRKIEEIVNNAYWLLTNESSGYNNQDRYGAQRIFEILNWIISQADNDLTLAKISKSNLHFKSIKLFIKHSLELVSKWQKVLTWIEGIRAIAPFCTNTNFVQLGNIYELCQFRCKAYKNFCNKVSSVLTETTAATLFFKNINLDIEYKIILATKDLTKENFSITNNMFDLVKVQNQYINYLNKIVNYLKNENEFALSNTILLYKLTNFELEKIKEMIKDINVVESDDPSKLIVIDNIKNKLLTIYDELNKLHKVSKSPSVWLDTTIINLNLFFKHFASISSETKKQIHQSMPGIIQIIRENYNEILNSAETSFLNFEKLVSFVTNMIDSEFESKVQSESEIGALQTTLTQEIINNTKILKEFSLLGVSYGMLPKEYKSIIRNKLMKSNLTNTLEIENTRFRLKVIESLKDIEMDLSLETINDRLILDFDVFSNINLSTIESIDLRMLFLKILAYSVLPLERNHLFSGFKLSMDAEQPSANIESISFFHRFVDLIYQVYLNNSEKFVSPILSDIKGSTYECLSASNYLNKFEQLKIGVNTFRRSTITPDGIIDFIDSILFSMKKIKLFISLAESDLSRLKLHVIQLSLLNYGKRFDEVDSLKLKIMSLYSEISRYKTLFEDAKNILLMSDPQTENSGSNLIKRLCSYLFSLKKKLDLTSGFENELMDSIDDLLPSENEMDVSKLLPQIQINLETALTTTSTFLKAVISIEDSINSYISNPIFLEAANQKILNECAEVISQMKSRCVQKEKSFENYSIKLFGRKLSFNVSEPIQIAENELLDVSKLTKQ